MLDVQVNQEDDKTRNQSTLLQKPRIANCVAPCDSGILRYDSSRCHWWRQSWYYDDFSLFLYAILVIHLAAANPLAVKDR